MTDIYIRIVARREWEEVSGLVKSNVEELVESVDRLGNTAIDSLGSVKERVGGAVFGTSAGTGAFPYNP